MSTARPLDEIVVKSTGEAVIEALRDAIVSGRLPEGHRLKEEELAQSLRASRTPIRRALAILEVEGLVETEPGHGAWVRVWDQGEIEDLLEIYATLFGLAAKRATARIQPDDLKALYASVDAFSKIDPSDAVALGVETARFHNIVVEVSGIHRINKIIAANLLPRARFATPMWDAPGQVEHTLVMHRRIAEALERGDAAEAEALMRDHVIDCRDSLLSHLRAQKG